MVKERLYCDGGVLGKNPSSHGGTFAWVLVLEDKILSHDYGLVTPADVGIDKITNNLTELLAVLRGLEAMPPLWKGLLFTDSLVTLKRMTNGNKFTNVPSFLAERAKKCREGRKWKGVLLKGHPSKQDLRKGYTARGRPVSPWNVWCDRKCQEIAQNFFAKLKEKEAPGKIL